jgi:hypothetical protein
MTVKDGILPEARAAAGMRLALAKRGVGHAAGGPAEAMPSRPVCTAHARGS